MKKVIGIVICIFILLVPSNLYAKDEDTSNVVISFTLTAKDRFTYEVKVSEGGSLYDGSQRITNGVMEYELSVGEKKEFRIIPDKGYEVKEIRKNDIVQDNKIEKIKISGVSGKSSLEVKYGKIEDTEKPEEPDIPNLPEDTSKPEVPKDTNVQGSIEEVDIVEKKENGISGLLMITGDTLKISTYISLLVIVLYGLYVRRKGKGINTVECDDNKKTLKEEKKDEK